MYVYLHNYIHVIYIYTHITVDCTTLMNSGAIFYRSSTPVFLHRIELYNNNYYDYKNV